VDAKMTARICFYEVMERATGIELRWILCCRGAIVYYKYGK
jgi:hypothetical protein